MTHLDIEQQLHIYSQMQRIRVFEEWCHTLYKRQVMPGITHLYIGEEAVAVGVCEALRDDDYITSTHRGHGHCLAKGAEFKPMFAELLGREAGYCKGKGGSMHIADFSLGNLGANGIVGGSAGIATGAGMSIKRKKSDQVAVCFFGEGAMGQGLLYECMNMASLWDLPVIYVCENNMYSEYTHFERNTAGSLLSRANAFGIDAREVDGQDVLAVYEAMQDIVTQTRSAQRPSFLLCHTYRYLGHHVGDIKRAYRSKDEETLWQETRDPLKNLATRLIESGMATQAMITQIEQEVQLEADQAVAYAKSMPFPAETEVMTDVYA